MQHCFTGFKKSFIDGGTGMQAKETRNLGFLALDSMLFTYMLGQKAANLAKESEILKNY